MSKLLDHTQPSEKAPSFPSDKCQVIYLSAHSITGVPIDYCRKTYPSIHTYEHAVLRANQDAQAMPAVIGFRVEWF